MTSLGFIRNPLRYSLFLFCLLAISSCSDALPETENGEQRTVGVLFSEVTLPAGLSDFKHENGAAGNMWYPEQMGSGGGFFDYNGDDWLDIILLGGGNWDPSKNSKSVRLYENLQDGTFKEVTQDTDLGKVVAYTIGVATGDADNDGDQDLFLSTITNNIFLRNDDGKFIDISDQSGLGERSEWSSSAMFVDVNDDGLLDLYAGNYVDWTPETDKWCPEGSMQKLYCIPADYEGIPSRFFLNKGNLKFEDVTEKSGFLPSIGKSLGVSELDYNRDGLSDMIVVNDGEGDLLYENKGDGIFEERGMVAGVAFSEHGEARAGMGVDVGVVDSTGRPTVFVGNFSEENVGIYKYQGNGTFRDRASTSKVGLPSYLTLTFGLVLIDVDSDSDLDLFTANGHVYPGRLEGQDKITYRQAPQLYLNDGSGVFTELKGDEAFLTDRIVARGAAYGDFDRDGDLDILMTENDGPAHLWRNDTELGRVLRVRLEGRTDNRDAIGTEVIVTAGGLDQYRRVRSGSSYLSASETVLTFGFGQADFAEKISIEWPNGTRNEFTNVAAGQEIYLRQGDESYQSEALPILTKTKSSYE